MAEKTQINYSVDVITKTQIEEIGIRTKRSQGNVIDWLVDEFIKHHPKFLSQKTSMPKSNTITE